MRSFLRYILLMAMAVALSSLTVVLGAWPMIAARRVFPRWAFWLGYLAVGGAMLGAGFIHQGLVFMTMAIASGVYVEIEEHGGSVFTSGSVAILAAFGSAVVGVGLWTYSMKAHFGEELRTRVQPLVDQLVAMNSSSGITVDAVVQQLPSAAVIALIIGLALALIFEKRLLTMTRASNEPASPATDRLSSFRVPDLTVWLVMLVILGAFLRHGNRWVELISVNAMNVLIVIYFFQGLAVVSQAFRTFKIGPVWQALWYFLLVVQLFLMVSLIGFADYWLEFRERLARKPAETEKGF